jgi:hypothetical protein
VEPLEKMSWEVPHIIKEAAGGALDRPIGPELFHLAKETNFPHRLVVSCENWGSYRRVKHI